MTAIQNKSDIVRTERGLTISGTRITLYDLMDYIHAGYPVKLIRNYFFTLLISNSTQRSPILRTITNRLRQNIKWFCKNLMQIAIIGKKLIKIDLPLQLVINLKIRRHGKNCKVGKLDWRLKHEVFN